MVLLHECDLHLPHDLVLDWDGPHKMGDFAHTIVRENQLARENGKSLHTFIVDGAVLNADSNDGATLLVTGGLKARSVVGSGAEIRIQGPAVLSEAAFGRYNDGIPGFEGGLTAPIYLNSDHDMGAKGEKNIEFDFFTFWSGLPKEDSEDEEEDENGDPPLPASLLA